MATIANNVLACHRTPGPGFHRGHWAKWRAARPAQKINIQLNESHYLLRDSLPEYGISLLKLSLRIG